jgi:hypothetical protein
LWECRLSRPALRKACTSALQSFGVFSFMNRPSGSVRHSTARALAGSSAKDLPQLRLSRAHRGGA